MANEPRFEVYPRDQVDYMEGGGKVRKRLTEYGWRFRAANGQITAIGGEGFTREQDAERAIDDFIESVGPIIVDPQEMIPAFRLPTVLHVDE